MNILSCRESRLFIVRETILKGLSSLEKSIDKEIHLNKKSFAYMSVLYAKNIYLF